MDIKMTVNNFQELIDSNYFNVDYDIKSSLLKEQLKVISHLSESLPYELVENTKTILDLSNIAIPAINSINNLTFSCQNCSLSEFIITDGSIIEGPANQALKKYNTYFDGEILYITN